MSVITHVHELQKKHEALSSKIEEAQRSPSTDDLYISDLKKQKLRLKEKINVALDYKEQEKNSNQKKKP